MFSGFGFVHSNIARSTVHVTHLCIADQEQEFNFYNVAKDVR